MFVLFLPRASCCTPMLPSVIIKSFDLALHVRKNELIFSYDVTSGLPGGLQISSTSGPSLKRLSKLDRLRVVQTQCHIDFNGTSSQRVGSRLRFPIPTTDNNFS